MRTMTDPRLSPRFHAAVALALQLHHTQRRKGTDIPYAAHLLAVTALVIEHGGSEDQAIAAVLHDAVEDQGGAATRDRIQDLFGDDVVAIIDALADTDQTPKPPWRARKEAHLAHVAHMPEPALLVLLADKVHNAQAIVRDVQEVGPEAWKRFNAAPEEIAWYYREMAAALQRRTEGWLTGELWRLADEIRLLAL